MVFQLSKNARKTAFAKFWQFSWSSWIKWALVLKAFVRTALKCGMLVGWLVVFLHMEHKHLNANDIIYHKKTGLEFLHRGGGRASSISWHNHHMMKIKGPEGQVTIQSKLLIQPTEISAIISPVLTYAHWCPFSINDTHTSIPIYVLHCHIVRRIILLKNF